MKRRLTLAALALALLAALHACRARPNYPDWSNGGRLFLTVMTQSPREDPVTITWTGEWLEYGDQLYPDIDIDALDDYDRQAFDDSNLFHNFPCSTLGCNAPEPNPETFTPQGPQMEFTTADRGRLGQGIWHLTVDIEPSEFPMPITCDYELSLFNTDRVEVVAVESSQECTIDVRLLESDEQNIAITGVRVEPNPTSPATPTSAIVSVANLEPNVANFSLIADRVRLPDGSVDTDPQFLISSDGLAPGPVAEGLSVGESFAEFSFEWDTSGFPAGDYELFFLASLPGDTDTTNNTASTTATIEIDRELAIPGSGISWTLPSLPVPELPHGNLGIQVTVANQGDLDEAGVVVRTTDANVQPQISAQQDIDRGDVANYGFSLSTVGVAPGPYSVTFTVDPVPGDDPANNQATLTIPIEPDRDGDLVADRADNCSDVHNPPTLFDQQLDTDGDGFGNHCDGDLDQDGCVGITDNGLVTAAIGAGDPIADFNGDGAVDNADFTIFTNVLFGNDLVQTASGLACACVTAQTPYHGGTAPECRDFTAGPAASCTPPVCP